MKKSTSRIPSGKIQKKKREKDLAHPALSSGPMSGKSPSPPPDTCPHLQKKNKKRKKKQKKMKKDLAHPALQSGPTSGKSPPPPPDTCPRPSSAPAARPEAGGLQKKKCIR